MTTIAATSDTGGNAGSVVENLLTDSSQPTVRRASRPDTQDDPRFSGKTPDQIVEMYRNLESHSGRLANELGQTRSQLSEALATSKRLADIRGAHEGSPARSADIDGVSLIADPKKALDGYLTEREGLIRDEVDKRVARLEAELAQTRFERNHPDAQALLNDPTVIQFAQATPLRQLLAQRVRSGDASAADALLTEYKQYKDKVAEPEAKSKTTMANKVSLESSRSSEASTASGGKTYKRADIVALKMSDPETYYSEAVQASLSRAYREGRVVE